jgi:hypothetical protein
MKMKHQPCSVSGCESHKVVALDMCDKHYRRFKRMGTTDLEPKPGEAMLWIVDHCGHLGDACFRWPFAISKINGRARVDFMGKTYPASRMMCIVAHGEPPAETMHAAHSCGNGHLGCLNPNHIRWATPVENMADRDLHGRTLKGERSPNARLTEADVIAMRQMYDAGEINADVARKFLVSDGCAYAVVMRRTWKHVA